MTILYYTILYYTNTILYYTILYYTILYYTILYYTILYTIYYTIYYTILYYTILYYTILYYNYTILYYTILYYNVAILYYTILYCLASAIPFNGSMSYHDAQLIQDARETVSLSCRDIAHCIWSLPATASVVKGKSMRVCILHVYHSCSLNIWYKPWKYEMLSCTNCQLLNEPLFSEMGSS